MGVKVLLMRTVLLVCGPVINALYRLLFKLRLGIMLLEKELAKAAPTTARGQAEHMRVINEGTCWPEFCDRLKGAGELVLRNPDSPSVQLSDLDRVEGLRYLTRVIRGGVEAFMDCADPAYPVLRPLPYNVKLGADNPDNLYMYGTISGQYTYRISGQRGTVTYLSFACYAGSRPGEGSCTPGHIDSSQLRLGTDGSFEIVASCQPPADAAVNWLRMERGTTKLVVRQTFLDRGLEAAATIRILRDDGPRGSEAEPGGCEAVSEARLVPAEPGACPPGQAGRCCGRPALEASEVTAALSGSAMFVNGAAMQFLAWSNMFSVKARNRLMVLDGDTYMTAWADPSIYFFHGYWSLKVDEALVIQVVPPDCPYWNFQLNNWWMESMDHENHRVHVNKRTATYGPDGRSVCIVVAARDPGLPHVSYIETAHHAHGTMAWRWVLAKQHPVPRCRVVPLQQLGQELSSCS